MKIIYTDNYVLIFLVASGVLGVKLIKPQQPKNIMSKIKFYSAVSL